MRLDPDWLLSQGEDGRLLHWVDTAFLPNDLNKIGVAVSGGGDSMALLHVLKRWRDQTGVPIAALTVDHNLREGSRAEAEQVAEICAEWGVPHDILTWEDWDGQGNLQAKAREARYRLIAGWAAKNGIEGVTLGHTKTDVAETFLMRLARKAGVEGLAAMDKVFDRNGVRWARPFLFETREDLRAYLRDKKISWSDDPSNDDTRFDRVKARQALAALAPLGIDEEALGQAAHHIFMGNSALEDYTLATAQTHVTVEDGCLTLKRRPPISAEIERRLLVKALQWVGRLDYPPRASTVQEIETGLVTADKATGCGCIFIRKGRDILIIRELQAVKDLTSLTTERWDGYWQLDGPHDPALKVRALGNAIKDCPDWRDTGLSRDVLMATPAVFDGDTLIAAPVAGLKNGWKAHIVADFTMTLHGH